MGWRRSAVVALAAGLLLTLSGCDAAPTEAWLVEPIRYDDAPDGDRGSMIDVTYEMGNLTEDTAGGFWTESVGSWLHLSGEGKTLRRFNLDGTGPTSSVNDIAALSPTELVVSHGALGPDRALSRFDTEAMQWQEVAAEGDWIGGVAVAGGSIFYVQYSAAPVVPTSFVVRRLDPSGELSTVTPAGKSFLAADAAIDVDPAGNIHVVTETERIVLAPGGTVSSREEHLTQHPFIALSREGEPLRPSTARPVDASWHLAGGSAEARAIIEEYSDCPGGGLAVGIDGAETVLPFLCGARAAVWLDDGSFVLSAGIEPGTVLARVTPP